MLESLPRPIFHMIINDFDTRDLHNLLCVSRFFNRRINCKEFWTHQIELKKTAFMKKCSELNEIDASLMAAARLGLKSYVQRFIDQKANVNVRMRLYEGRDLIFSPIDQGAFSGVLSCVKLLVKNHATFLSKKTPWMLENSPIHFAAASGSVDCVKYFLDSGVSVDQATLISPFGLGLTSLEIAAKYKNVEVCQLLLKRGADINYVNHQGSDYYRPIHYACDSGSVECLILFIKAGADVNVLSKSGKSLLCLAIARNDERCIQILLAHGANPKHLYRKNGFDLPLQSAMLAGHFKAAKALLDFDATLIDCVYTKPGAILPLGDKTVLHIEGIRGNIHALKFLLNYHPNPHLVCVKDKTALDYAVENGHDECANILYDYAIEWDFNHYSRPLVEMIMENN
jgi:ankyrin repeat protein